MGKTLCCEGYKPAKLKRKKKKKKEIAQASLSNTSGLAEQKGRTGPRKSYTFYALGQDLTPKGGLWAQCERSQRLFMPNSQDPILRFQGFQSGVGTGGGGEGRMQG